MRFQAPAYEQIPRVAELVRAMDRTVSGLEPTKLRLALTLRRFMVAAAHGHPRPSQNIVIIGPSGGGKTFLIRALLGVCPVIWTEADATAFSDVGWIGRDLTSIYLGLLEPRWRGEAPKRKRGEPPPSEADRPWAQAEMVKLAARWGVVVIDEWDKLRVDKRANLGADRDKGKNLQSELLKLVEGVDAVAKRQDSDAGVTIPTHNILHVAVGAFQGLSRLVSAELAKTGNAPENAYMKAGILNLIDYGFLEELVGRFSTIVTLPPLNAEHMARILREHVVPEAERQCADDGIELRVDAGAVSTLAARAAGLPIGARALVPMLEDCLAKAWARAEPGDVLALTADSASQGTSVLLRSAAA